MRILIAAIAAACLAGCSTSGRSTTVSLTEHQRDSILATQKAIPGAATVGRALDLQSSTGQRAAGMDSLVH